MIFFLADSRQKQIKMPLSLAVWFPHKSIQFVSGSSLKKKTFYACCPFLHSRHLLDGFYSGSSYRARVGTLL